MCKLFSINSVTCRCELMIIAMKNIFALLRCCYLSLKQSCIFFAISLIVRQLDCADTTNKLRLHQHRAFGQKQVRIFQQSGAAG